MSIWEIKDKRDWNEFQSVTEVQVIVGSKRSDLIYKKVSNVVFYPSMKMLEFTDNDGKLIFVHGHFILKGELAILKKT